MVRYELSCEVPASPASVFEYCTQVEGFRRQFPFTVKWLGDEKEWDRGVELNFRYRLAGLWIPHVAEILEFERDRLFVDRMKKGLYRSFEHTHLFEPAAGGTKVTDRVDFSFGLGRWLDETLGRATLHRTFQKRHRALIEHFEKGH